MDLNKEQKWICTDKKTCSGKKNKEKEEILTAF